MVERRTRSTARIMATATGGIDDLNAKLAEMTMVQLRDELKK